MKDRELQREIKECAAYLSQKERRDLFWAGREMEPGQAETRRAELKRRLDDINKQAAALNEAMVPVRLALHREVRFGPISDRIEQAVHHVRQARLEIMLALAEELPPGTREMTLQRSAVRLAHALVGTSAPRKVRGVAKRIMLEAGLEEPNERTVTNWLRDEREDDRLSEQRAREMENNYPPER